MNVHSVVFHRSTVMALAAVLWTFMSIDVAARPAAKQVKNVKWRIRGSAVHGGFDVDVAKFKPLLERQVVALIRKHSPRLFGRFSVLVRRYERGRLVSDKVQIASVKRGANRIAFDIQGHVVADRYARVVRWKRRRPVTRWVRRGTTRLARYRLIGHATLSVVQGARLSGRFLRVVVRGRRLRAEIKLPAPLKIAIKLGNRKLTTRRLAVLDKRMLRRHPLLRSARLVKFQFLPSGTGLMRVRFIAR